MENKITYIQQGDYLLPDLVLPEQPKVKIGIWGRRHEQYIKHHHKLLYFNLLTSCKLTAYLADIDEQAENMFFRCIYSVPYLNKHDFFYRLATIQQSKLIECNILFVSLCNSIGFCEFDGGSE